MAATPYRPISWNDSVITYEKLQQMANNDQWLFENNPRMRYMSNGIVRDNGLKIIAGKASFPAQNVDYYGFPIYFGNFFSASCKPIVTATASSPAPNSRALITTSGLGGGEVDYRGFYAYISVGTPSGWYALKVTTLAGWCHWTAIGY